MGCRSVDLFRETLVETLNVIHMKLGEGMWSIFWGGGGRGRGLEFDFFFKLIISFRLVFVHISIKFVNFV